MAACYTGKIRLPLHQNTGINSFYFILNQGTQHDYYIKIDNRIYDFPNPKISFSISVKDTDSLLKELRNVNSLNNTSLIFNACFILFNLFLILFTLLQWLIHKQNVYLYYCLYIFSFALFYLCRENHMFGLTGYWFSANRENISRIAVTGAGLAYVLFAYSFLEISRESNPFLCKVKTATIVIMFSFGLFWQLAACIGFYNLALFKITRNLLMIVFAPVLFYYITKLQSSLKWFILLGSSLLIIFGVLGMINEYRWFGINKIELFGASYIKLGMMLELLVFSTALGYRTKLIQDKLSQKLQVEKEKADIENKLSQTELRLIKAQINPHFLFNSFNSIKNLIHQGRNEAASMYLSKFAKMMRSILNVNEVQNHSIHEEILFIENYVRLESLRFGKEISFNTHIDEPAGQILIPTLILQPLVENAIWHGLMPLKEERKIDIYAKITDHTLCIEVVDNGIGLDEITNSRSDQASYGIKLVQDRLKIFNVASRFEMKNREVGNGVVSRICFEL